MTKDWIRFAGEYESQHEKEQAALEKLDELL